VEAGTLGSGLPDCAVVGEDVVVRAEELVAVVVGGALLGVVGFADVVGAAVVRSGVVVVVPPGS
jgi:hypothetical protein